MLQPLLVTSLCFLLSWIQVAAGDGNSKIYQATCRHDLGMQSGAIKDWWLSASSSYDNSSVGPSSGRIRVERNGGAWCPKHAISRNVYEWLEIDLQSLHKVTLLETQGRFGNGHGREYAEAFRLEYQRVDGGPWIHFRNRSGQEVFAGNENTYLAKMQELHPPIITRKVRIVPYSSHPRMVCMRVEMYGCNWTSGIVSYSMPQGDRRGSEVDLYDYTYDGDMVDNHLTGGLGQLVDGEVGSDNFRADSQHRGHKGYSWVGWKTDKVTDASPVEILFEFDSVRNFSEVRIFGNNMFTKDVRIFKATRIYFSVSGTIWQEKPLMFSYFRDALIENARHVIIPIHHRIARYVRVQLFFDARWIMISEVRFESVVAGPNYEIETASNNAEVTVRTTSDHDSRVKFRGEAESDERRGATADPDPALNDELIGIIIGALASLIVIICIIIVFCIIRNRRQHKTADKKASKFASPVTLDLGELRALNGSRKVGNGRTDGLTPDEADLFPPYCQHPLLSNGGGVYAGEGEIQARTLPPPPYRGGISDTLTTHNSSCDYAIPGDFRPSAFQPVVPPKPSSFFPPPVPPPPAAQYDPMPAAYDPGIMADPVTGHYAVSMVMDEPEVTEFPRDGLVFQEKLGQGQYGEVHLCVAKNVSALLGDDFLVNRTNNGDTMLVAVKILQENEEEARRLFYNEARLMARVKDPNIVGVLGVCSEGDPVCMVLEYMKFGDLNQYLQNHQLLPEDGTSVPNVKHLSVGSLTYMAAQVASGMKYLEGLNMIHRDLATRNCLVGPNYTIKISDFGMSRSLFTNDYYRLEGQALLPIRWMAWESVILGKFSSRSDVWSFGVTLWEVYTLCREQPYAELEDQQVIDNCAAYYHNSGPVSNLPPPPACPREVYDLLLECWQRDEAQRPSFRDIHLFLLRKNMGYNPKQDRSNIYEARTHSSTPTQFN